MKKRNVKGFTLAELLVVVAIIAILIAIAIPVFTSQAEKARQSADAANIRSAYAEAVVNALENEGEGNATTDAVMQSEKWDKMSPDKTEIGGVLLNDMKSDKDQKTAFSKQKDKAVKVYVTNNDTVYFMVAN